MALGKPRQDTWLTHAPELAIRPKWCQSSFAMAHYFSANLPIWYQLSQKLRADIIAGKLKPGQKIEAEVPLSKTYGISVAPVRQALRVLEEEGYVTRQRGSGTYVNKTLTLPAHGVTSLEALYSHEFSKPAHIIEYTSIVTPAQYEAHFPDENDLAIVRRLTFRDDRPWSFGNLYFSNAHREKISEQMLQNYPLYRLLEEYCGLTLDHSQFEASAVAADMDTADQLQIDPYSPCLFLSSVGFNKNGIAIGAFSMAFLGDPFVFGFETQHQVG